jgi:hypothetical protein
MPAPERRITSPPIETPSSVPRVLEGASTGAVRRSSSATPVNRSAIEPAVEVQPRGEPADHRSAAAAAADLNAVAGVWDDMVAGIRRERPFIATLLEQALPVATTAEGVLTVQVSAPEVQEGIDAKSAEVREVMSSWLRGLRRVAVKLAGAGSVPTPRMTVETVKSETLAALRRRDPVLASAIDLLELDLVD